MMFFPFLSSPPPLLLRERIGSEKIVAIGKIIQVCNLEGRQENYFRGGKLTALRGAILHMCPIFPIAIFSLHNNFYYRQFHHNDDNNNLV